MLSIVELGSAAGRDVGAAPVIAALLEAVVRDLLYELVAVIVALVW